MIEKISNSSFKLELPKTWKHLHPVFNEVLLTAHHEPEFPTQPRNSRPPPIIVGNEPEFEVEKVLDSKIIRKTFKYKVQWKGYGAHEQTWEPISNLDNAKDAIADYHKQFPKKPKPTVLRKLEIPITLFDTKLFRPMPKPDTEPVPENLPSEALVYKLARVWKRSP